MTATVDRAQPLVIEEFFVPKTAIRSSLAGLLQGQDNPNDWR
jgi:hypothetical protein